MNASAEALRVDWLGAADDPRLRLLQHFGLQVAPADAPDEEAFFVLPLSRWNGRPLPSRGGLLLVDGAEQESQWLAQMPAHCEVAREPASALLIYERLRRLAHRQDDARWSAAAPLDPLTGCLSRAGWTRLLQQRLSQPEQDTSALLLFDLDGFRAFNEQHGHAVGDRALVELVARCRQGLAEHDVLGRWGGDEFALLLRRYDAESLLLDARALLVGLAGQPLTPDGSQGWARWLRAATPAPRLPAASAGLAWLRSGCNFGELLAEADSALQRARQRQRGQLELSRPAPGAGAGRPAAQTDALTQTANRAYCETRLARELAAAEQEAWPLALWLVDLRGLGALNASAGYAQGDRALARLAQVLRAQARLTDWCARVRASALVVVMPHTDAPGGEVAAERLRSAVAALDLPCSLSLVQREPGEGSEALLARAWQSRLPLLSAGG